MITIATRIAAIPVVMTIAALPSAAVQTPAVIALLPLGTLIVVTDACALPMSSGPHMPSAVPVPVTRHPFMPPARCGNDFISYRRRCIADNHIDTYLRNRLSRDKCSGTKNNCCGSTEDTFHTNLQTKWCAIQYIELPTGDNKRCICLQDIHRACIALCASEQIENGRFGFSRKRWQ